MMVYMTLLNVLLVEAIHCVMKSQFILKTLLELAYAI